MWIWLGVMGGFVGGGQNANWAENETVHARLSVAPWTDWLGQCPDFLVPVAVRGVVIHHPHCLHEGVADG